jgi:hypothetical protein
LVFDCNVNLVCILFSFCLFVCFCISSNIYSFSLFSFLFCHYVSPLCIIHHHYYTFHLHHHYFVSIIIILPLSSSFCLHHHHFVFIIIIPLLSSLFHFYHYYYSFPLSLLFNFHHYYLFLSLSLPLFYHLIVSIIFDLGFLSLYFLIQFRIYYS